MKKFLLSITVIVVATVLYAKAADISFSKNGMNINGNIKRSGSHILINYKMSGIENGANSLPNISQFKAGPLKQVSSADISMEIDCREMKSRIVSTALYNPDSSGVYSYKPTNWIRIDDPDEYKQISELCMQYK